jgi:hypothetical protein
MAEVLNVKAKASIHGEVTWETSVELGAEFSATLMKPNIAKLYYLMEKEAQQKTS